MPSFGLRELVLFVGVFLGCVWIHQPWRYYFFGDSWEVLYGLLTDWRNIFWPQNEHYIPLFKALYLLEYKLFGSHHLGYMLVLLAMHSGIAVLVYRVALRLSLRPWLSVLAATLFAFSSVHWEVTGWSFEQQFALGLLLMMGAIYVFLSPQPGRGFPITVAFLSLAALLSGGLVALSLPLILTSYCLLRACYRPASDRAGLGVRLVAVWLPVVIYFLVQVGHISVPGASPVPRLSLRDVPGYIDYTLFGGVYGVILPGLTLFQAQNLSSIGLILILLAALLLFCYRQFSPDQRLSFWFLIVFLFAPSLITGLGRLRLGMAAATSSRYAYLPGVPFALLVALCWQATHQRKPEIAKTLWNSAGLVLVAYYFIFHFAALRRHNPAADRGQLAQQFMTVARTATYPSELRDGEHVLGPELRVPDYVCAPGPFPLWKAFQVLDGDTGTIVPVRDYLKDENASSAFNLVRTGDFETPDQMAQWASLSPGKSVLSKEAAHTGILGVQLTLGPSSTFSEKVIDTCPSVIPQTIFTLSVQTRSSQADAVVARIISKDSHGNILATAPSQPHSGNNQWEPLVVSGLSAPGSCMLGIDISM